MDERGDYGKDGMNGTDGSYSKGNSVCSVYSVFSASSLPCPDITLRQKMKKIFFSLVFTCLLASLAFAQEFEIKKYDINARVVPEEQKVDVQAKLRLVNLSGPDLAERILLSSGDKPRLSFFLNPKAKVGTMKVNGAAVQPKT